MNNREHTLSYCTECLNRKFDLQKGVICKLINDIPNFESTCPDFNEDGEVIQRNTSAQNNLNGLNREIDLEEETWGLNKFGINNGIAAGVLMIICALAWFFGGLIIGVIFYYPPILLILGIVTLFKGIKTNKRKAKLKEISKKVLDQEFED